jgi:hypothetical protein
MRTRGQDNDFAQRLDEDGFFVWRSLVPHDLIDLHLSAYQLFQTETGFDPKHVRYDDSVIAWHYEQIPTMDLIYNAQLMDFLRYRFGAEPVMALPMTGFSSWETGPHTDSTAFVVDPPRSQLRLWIALEDIHPDSGPIYFMPGSHRTISTTLREAVLIEHPDLRQALIDHSKPTTVEAFEKATAPANRYLLEAIEKRLSRLSLPRVAPALKKGDAVIFEMDTVHGSSPWINRQHTRKHMIMTWSSIKSRWFGPRYYWGPSHDYRCAEYAATFPIVLTSHGLRLDKCSHYRGRAIDDDYSRPVVACRDEFVSMTGSSAEQRNISV